MSNQQFPLIPYSQYSSSTLSMIHLFDKYIPIISFIYLIFLFILYTYQYMKNTNFYVKHLHRIAIVSLLILIIFNILLFNLAWNIWTLDIFPSFIDCQFIQEINFIFFVLLKYSIIVITVYNMSHMVQNPYLNIRYKYINKQQRKRLKRVFILLKIIIIFLFVLNVYSACKHTQSYLYFDYNPIEQKTVKYCYLTFSAYTYVCTFGSDVVSLLLFSCLFGRNVFKCSRRDVRPQQYFSNANRNRKQLESISSGKQKILMVNENNSMSTEDEKVFEDETEVVVIAEDGGQDNVRGILNFDMDDPIRKYFGSSVSFFLAENESEKYFVISTTVNNVVDNDNVYYQLLLTSEIIDEVINEELEGMQKQKRMLKLIWIQIIFYWLNILLMTFFGIYSSISAVNVIVCGSCIVLFNDCEFDSCYFLVV